MNHNYIGIILTLLLTLAKLLTMKGMEHNPIIRNSTHFTVMTSRNYTLHTTNNRSNPKVGNKRNRKVVIINIPSTRNLKRSRNFEDSIETTTFSNHYVIIPKPILSKDNNENASIIQFSNDESISNIENPFITKTYSYDIMYTTESPPVLKSSNDIYTNKSCDMSNMTNCINQTTSDRKTMRSGRRINHGKVPLNRNNRRKIQNLLKNARRRRKPNEKFDIFDEDESNFPVSIRDGSEDHNEYDGLNDEYNVGDENNDEETRDYESKGTSSHWDNVDPLRYHHEPINLHKEHRWIPTKSIHKRHKHDDSNKDDKMAIEKLHNMFYCNKYCHCCKKDKPPEMEAHHEEHDRLGKFVSSVKRFGLDPIRRQIYGRGFKDRIADSDHHVISTDKMMELEDVDEEIFVFFDKEEDEPSGVSECKGVCGCCVDVKRRQLAAKMKQKMKDEEKKESVDGITGVIRQLLYKDDEKPKGRSASDGIFGVIRRFFGKDDSDNISKGRSLSDGINENSKLSKIGYVQKLDGNIKYDTEHPFDVPHEVHDEHEHDVEHDDHLKFFDCSKCCEFCEVKPKRRRKRPFGAEGGLDLLDFLRSFLGDKPPLGDYNDDYAYSPSYTDGSTSVSLAGPSNYLYDYNYFYYVPGSAPASSSSSTCCSNTTVLGQVITMGALGAVVTSGLSGMNIMFFVLLPMLTVGFILVATFLGFQAATPIGFLPLFIIVPLMAIVPLAMVGMAPLALTPAVLPLLGGGGGGVTTNVVTTCTGANCTGTNRTVDYPPHEDDSISNKLIETTTIVNLDNSLQGDTSINLVDSNQVGRQFSLPSSNLYWNLKEVLNSDSCLERAGCHLAVYTHAINIYNNFIIRILEKFSQSFKDSRFTAYKDAYQIGSSKMTNHDNCTTMYYCTDYRKYIKKIIKLHKQHE